MREYFWIALLALGLAEISAMGGNHLPEAALNLNERFFDEVRELIKRRMEVSRNSVIFQFRFLLFFSLSLSSSKSLL